MTEQSEVLAVNGISVSEVAGLWREARRASVGEALTYKIRRRGRTESISLKLENPLRTPLIAVDLVISLLSSVSFVLVGSLVLYKRFGDRRAQVLYAMSVVSAVRILSSAVTGVDVADPLGLANARVFGFDDVLEIILASLFFVLLLHLALIFPKPRPILQKRSGLVGWLYLPAFLIVVWGVVAPISDHWPQFAQVLLSILLYASFTVAVFGFLPAACLTLIRSYRECKAEEKRQLRWPLWGTLVAVAVGFGVPFGASFLTGLLGEAPAATSIDLFEPVLKGSVLLIPISFAFAILEYRLMEIDRILEKTAVYGLVTFVVLSGYLLFAGLLGGFLIRVTGLQSQWIAIGFTLLVVGIFVPLRSRAQSIVDSKFFPRVVDYPKALKEIGRAVVEAQEEEIFLERVLETLQSALRNRSVLLALKETRGGSFRASAKVGLPDEILEQTVFERESHLLATLQRPVFPRSENLPEEDSRKLRTCGDALAVPVRFEGELIGFLALGEKLDRDDYDAEDMEFVTALADQLAAGLRTLRAREQTAEFEQARRIQEGLLPKEIPKVPGYAISGRSRPARVVGGDYFDVLKFDEQRVGLCIADVAGKGMAAALLMSNLQAVVRAFASVELAPQQLCGRIDRVIRANMAGRGFITLFFALLDAEAGRLLYTNAGHNPPILMRTDGSYAELCAGGPVLGAFRDSHYEQEDVKLCAGDRLLLFTDGVTEARNAAQEEFGEQRLLRLLAENRTLGACPLQERVMETVTAFSGGHLSDDVTLLVVAAL